MEQFFETLSRFIRQGFPDKSSPWFRYGFTIVLIVASLPVKFFVHQLYGDVVAFYLLTTTITLSASICGLGPGILATFLTAILSTFFFVPPHNTFTFSEDSSLTVLFIIEGLLISVISDARRRADIQKGEFIAYASHELKNPLAVASGYAGLIIKKLSKSKNKALINYATEVNNHIQKANDLVGDLLDMTKIEVGNLTYYDEPFDVNNLVIEVVKDQTVAQVNHQLVLNSSSKKVMVGDRYRIKQVLINLITNAIKYSPNAKKINIRLKDVPKGVELSVQDFGVGISHKDQTRIFRRYYRSSTEKRSKIQGLGLGLYISQQILKHHKARLWLKSELGKGSTFYLFLPTNYKTN